MKFIQTDNQIVIKMSGAGQLVIGVIFFLAGVALTVLGFSLPNNTHSTTTVSASSTTTTSAHAGLYVTLFGLVFAVVGLLVMLVSKSQQTVIQKAGQMTIGTKRLLGGHKAQQSLATADIAKVVLVTYLSTTNNVGPNNGGGGSQRRSNLLVVMNNNDSVVVAEKSSNAGFSIDGMNVSSLIQKAPLGKEAQELATFLNVPLETSDTSTLAGAVGTITKAITNGIDQARGTTPTGENQTPPAAQMPPVQQPAAPLNPTEPPQDPPQQQPPVAQS